MFDGGIEESHHVLTFLENRQLKELIQSYLEKGSVSEVEQLMVRRFLMCYIVYLKAGSSRVQLFVALCRSCKELNLTKQKTATVFCTE